MKSITDQELIRVLEETTSSLIDLQIDSLVEFTGKKRRKRLLYASMSSDRVHAIISALPCNPWYFCYKIEKTYQFIASFYVYIILQFTCYQHAKAKKIRAKRTGVSVGSSMNGFLRESFPQILCSTLSTLASDSAPSEARKRGTGGGSPRKIDEWFSEGRIPSDPL